MTLAPLFLSVGVQNGSLKVKALKDGQYHPQKALFDTDYAGMF